MNIEKELKQKGYRNSKNRNAVLKLLQDANEPVTADYIYDELRKTNPSVSLSTVYRILESLTSSNITVKLLIMNDNKARYEIRNFKHVHHLICKSCNKLIPIDCCPIKWFENKQWEDTGFTVTGHRLEIYGICSECNTN